MTRGLTITLHVARAYEGKVHGQKIVWAKVHFSEEKNVLEPHLWPKIVLRPSESITYSHIKVRCTNQSAPATSHHIIA